MIEIYFDEEKIIALADRIKEKDKTSECPDVFQRIVFEIGDEDDKDFVQIRRCWKWQNHDKTRKCGLSYKQLHNLVKKGYIEISQMDKEKKRAIEKMREYCRSRKVCNDCIFDQCFENRLRMPKLISKREALKMAFLISVEEGK